MGRVTLVHWNAAEAGERAERLRAAGHEVQVHSDQGGAPALRALRDAPPDAIVIDLARLPSQGCSLGTWLRQQKGTRHVPLVFVEGDPGKTPRVRSVLPDATFATWASIDGALSAALGAPAGEVVVPGIMAPYAGTPVPQKLGIGAETTLALLDAPDDAETVIGPIPDGARVRRDARAKSSVVILFSRREADLERRFASAARAVADRGRLWIAWPKQASGAGSDLTQNGVRAFGLGAGWVDYKIAALDETWSALCFALKR